MPLSLSHVLISAGIDPKDVLVMRHSYVKEHEGSGLRGIHMDSTDAEILEYTRSQSVDASKFPENPPRFWVIFLKESGSRARFWSIVENHGEVSTDRFLRKFELSVSDMMETLRNRLVIHWPSPRAWRVSGSTASKYRVLEISDAHPTPFPGFDRLILSHSQLKSVMNEPRFESWRVALSSVAGIYLITDTSDGRQYIGKADGAETIKQRWTSYAANGHGGNIELKNLDPSSFRYSVMRVFDPSTARSMIDEAESHFKQALDTRRNGLNRN